MLAFLKKYWPITLVALLGLSLRLYRIAEYLTFLGDEGRDVRVVRDLITAGNLVFIGPQTSIGNMYLGPLYYYMMAPALFLSRLDPVGPAVMVALLATATIIFTWYVARSWFGDRAGIIAALLFASAPVAIIYAHSSWNPNPMPFFALTCAWGIYQVWQHQRFFWLGIVGISLAFALQMHYLGLLLVPFLAVFWLLSFRDVFKNSKQKTSLVRHSLLALLLFLLLMSPLLLFDLKHDFLNFNAFKTFFTNRQTTVNLNPVRSDRFLPAIESVVSELLLARQMAYAGLAAFVIAMVSIWAFLGKPKLSLKQLLVKRKDPALSLLFVWILFGILGLGIYKQHIYAHYFGFLFPAVYILVGYLLSFLLSKSVVFKLLAAAALAGLLYLGLLFSPLKQEPNRQLQRTRDVVELIITESAGSPFNFGLIAKQNYDESYRYFLENKKAALVRGEESISDQLFVVCEDGDDCQPEGNPAWQIAVFGPAKVEQLWQIDSIKIYKLTHTDAGSQPSSQ